ncbi:MAG: hypothetical protein R3F59_28520 [Myxococcota bacterium]
MAITLAACLAGWINARHRRLIMPIHQRDLGMLTGLRGATYVIVEAFGQSGSLFAFHEGLFSLHQHDGLVVAADLPDRACVSAAAALIVARWRLGCHVRAVGGDLAAARAGISVARVRTGALLPSPSARGLAGSSMSDSSARCRGFLGLVRVPPARGAHDRGLPDPPRRVGALVGGALGFRRCRCCKHLDRSGISPHTGTSS